MRALVIVGGWAHPAEQTGPPMAEALESLGLHVDVVSTMDAAADHLASNGTDLLVVHTCRFLMLDARYTETQRAEFRYYTPDAVRAAIAAHVAAGRPVLAMHTAPLCFDDWADWPSIVGGRWDWERSNHPPPGEFRVELAPAHPVTAGLGSFAIVDELYRFVSPAAGAEVVATAVDADGIEQPLVWLHQRGAARVAYDSLGHDHRSLANVSHRALLSRLVGWLGVAD